MALGSGYDRQGCYLARALEVVGERWTLLILRDCFYGVRHFNDLLRHLDISRAVLTDRLGTLVDAGVLERRRTGRDIDYELTEAGIALWPTIYSMCKWGERYLSGEHPTRVFSHADCGTELDDLGRCPACAVTPAVHDLTVRPGPGHNAARRDDPVALALATPHRMLAPLP